MAEYIERSAVLYAFLDEYPDAHYPDYYAEKIVRIPAADVAPVRHGKWIPVSTAYGEYKCSVCDGMDSDCSDYYGSHGVLNQDYCPYCGAKMDGAEK